MYAIEIHGGFMIKEFVEKFCNCTVTRNLDEALKFESEELAKQFISKNDGNGLNKKTAKIIPAT